MTDLLSFFFNLYPHFLIIFPYYSRSLIGGKRLIQEAVSILNSGIFFPIIFRKLPALSHITPKKQLHFCMLVLPRARLCMPFGQFQIEESRIENNSTPTGSVGI
ncbi:MAG: hypothetical protein ABFR90_10525, partial [Planctomycetota bacterium]